MFRISLFLLVILFVVLLISLIVFVRIFKSFVWNNNKLVRLKLCKILNRVIFGISLSTYMSVYLINIENFKNEYLVIVAFYLIAFIFSTNYIIASKYVDVDLKYPLVFKINSLNSILATLAIIIFLIK